MSTKQEAADLVIRAVNALLTAEGRPYRVAADMTMSRINGYTLLALRETQDAVDWRHCAPPVNNMEARQ